jgi:hypothetical protein
MTMFAPHEAVVGLLAILHALSTSQLAALRVYRTLGPRLGGPPGREPRGQSSAADARARGRRTCSATHG